MVSFSFIFLHTFSFYYTTLCWQILEQTVNAKQKEFNKRILSEHMKDITT